MRARVTFAPKTIGRAEPRARVSYLATRETNRIPRAAGEPLRNGVFPLGFVISTVQIGRLLSDQYRARTRKGAARGSWVHAARSSRCSSRRSSRRRRVRIPAAATARAGRGRACRAETSELAVRRVVSEAACSGLGAPPTATATTKTTVTTMADSTAASLVPCPSCSPTPPTRRSSRCVARAWTFCAPCAGPSRPSSSSAPTAAASPSSSTNSSACPAAKVSASDTRERRRLRACGRGARPNAP